MEASSQSARQVRSDSGSIAPLGLGLSVVSLLAILVTLSAGSLYLTERRLTAVAEFAALAVLQRSEGDFRLPLEPLTERFLSQHPLHGLNSVRLISAISEDGKSVRVRLCSSSEPIFSYIFSEVGMVCSEGLARFGR